MIGEIDKLYKYTTSVALDVNKLYKEILTCFDNILDKIIK